MTIFDQWHAILAMFGVFAAAMLSQARQEQVYGDRKSAAGWLASGLAFLAVCVVGVLFVVREPGFMQQKAPTGYGLEWSCERGTKGGQSCVRDPAKF